MFGAVYGFPSFYFSKHGGEKKQNLISQFFCQKSHCWIAPVNGQLQNRTEEAEMLWFFCGNFWKSPDCTLWWITHLKVVSENHPGWYYWLEMLSMVVLSVLLANPSEGVPLSEAIHTLSVTPDTLACISPSSCYNFDFSCFKIISPNAWRISPK